MRKGKWKLMASGNSKTWELYDVEADRLESQNVADAQPNVVKELSADYERWANRRGEQDYSELQARRRNSD